MDFTFLSSSGQRSVQGIYFFIDILCTLSTYGINVGLLR